MKKPLLTLFMLIFGTTLYANEPAQVMLIGTFHFDNPGNDVVKVTDVDILAKDSQQYLETFSQRLAAFKPTHVLLEYGREDDELLNQRYRNYLAGNYQLGANEIYQLGFRIARAAGLESLQSFDHRDLQWAAEPMFEYAKAHNSPEMKVYDKIIANITEEEKQALANLGLRELLMRSNDSRQDQKNMDIYLSTNAIGVGVEVNGYF
jgi:hypothetical protein